MKRLPCQTLRAPQLLAASTLSLLPCINWAAIDRDLREVTDFPHTVSIVYDGDSVVVSGADAAGVTVSTSGAGVAITSTVPGVSYELAGASSAGYLQVTSSERCQIILAGVDLASTNGPAVSVLGSERTFLVLAKGTENSLMDSASYSRTGKGTVHTGGALIVSGTGALELTSLGGHGIYTDKRLRILEGILTVADAAKDALHPKAAFRMDGGQVWLHAQGDGIDAASGIEVTGGRIDFVSTVADVKGLATDALLEISGGTVTCDIGGDQSKALSAKGDIALHGGALFLNLSGNVVLTTVTADDSSTFTDPSYCTAVKTDGDVVIDGGRLAITHTGIAGKGISADGSVTIAGGALDITLSGGPSASYVDADGVTDTAAADAIKADGDLNITDGQFVLDLQGQASDGFSADGSVQISGGTFTAKASGSQSKIIKSDGAMMLSGGDFQFTLSGGVVLEQVATSRYDPSYCTAFKSGGLLTITGGTATITHSGTAGKGISADGDVLMQGGSFTITTSGGVSSSFTNELGVLDMASADGFKTDGNLTITGGTLHVTSTGTGGDAISCDGAAVIGVQGQSTGPVIGAHTRGSRILLSGSDYVNAKAFKAEGNLTMHGGTFTASTTTNGGEGMESKANLVINGGTIEISAYDDGINAASSITINGGNIYCYSSNNDGIDSNGTIRITGGTIVSSGSTAPEEGFDCDNNNFTITGGTLVGTGGATSTPTASTSTQRSLIYKGAGSLNTILQIKSASGNVLVYKLPRTYSGGGGFGGGSTAAMTLLFSASGLTSGTSYSLISGATVSGGTEFHGLYTGATVTGGTTLKTFTPTNIVTTVQ